MRIFRSLLLFFLALCGLSAMAQELTITSLTASASDGIVLTFSQDVKVSHSIFGTKCYNEIIDNDATPSSLNANPSTHGNVVTLTAAYCYFVNGHSIHLVLNPACFTTLDGATQLTGTTVFDFIMGDGAPAEPITALQVAPSNGTLLHLANISIVFTPTIGGILDPTGFTITNENGHSLPIINVIVDTETPIYALNVNVDTEHAALEGGTTYSLHIAPGAIKCGDITNDQELVYGKWYIKPEPLALVTNPPHQSMTEEISQITIQAEKGGRIRCTDLNCKGIAITGMMEDKDNVYATVTKIEADRTNSFYTLTLDRPVNAESLAASNALYKYVKMSFPEGLFQQQNFINDAFQTVWKIDTPKPLGPFTWKFSPQPGSTLESLGNPLTVETPPTTEGETSGTTEIYTLNFSITGTNAYMTITNADAIKIIDADTGRTVKSFSRGDLRQENTSAFMLIMDRPMMQNGRFSLVIPASSVNYYSDAEHYSPVQHPQSDIIATWTVNNPNAPLYGDANGDGDVTVSDISAGIDAIHHPDTSTVILKNADCDNDGSVTVSDIEEIQKIILRTE